MAETLSIEKNKILMVVHNLEAMRDIFSEKQFLFTEKERIMFFEARNKIYHILADCIGEEKYFKNTPLTSS